MSRNMIAANQTIFKSLDEFCAARKTSVDNAGAPRWIGTDPQGRALLKDGVLKGQFAFSPSKIIVRIDYQTDTYFCTIGFESAEQLLGFSDIELTGGMLTLLLSAAMPRPTASAVEIKNIVEAQDKAADPDYPGHEFTVIARFYPPIRIHSAVAVDDSATWNTFFRLCIMESRDSHSWIEANLLDTLESICGLDLVNFPYKTLCRSIFDTDPAAVFLALYRCMEAIYAYSSATKVIRGLGIPQSWSEVATVLEDELGWHPREEGSLVDLMSHALENDLLAIFSAMNVASPEEKGSALAASAARRIYKLRNGLVHYRPSQSSLDLEEISWNQLCTAMSNIVCDMYAGVFS